MGTYMCQTLGNTSLAPRYQGHGMGAAPQPQCTLQPLRPRGSTCSSPAPPKIRPRNRGASTGEEEGPAEAKALAIILRSGTRVTVPRPS